MNDTDRRDAATARAAHRYTALLRLYPAEHRRAFGPLMVQTFKDQYREASIHEETGLGFWLAVIGDALRSGMKERAMTLRARQTYDALMMTVIITIGNILIFPQGIVPLLFHVFQVDVRSWFVALYLPQPYQIPVCLLAIVLGLTQWYAVWSARKGCTNGDAVEDAIRTKGRI